MAITFYIANDIKDAQGVREAVDLEEEIYGVFYGNKELLGKEGEIILNLDPYGTQIFTIQEVEMLIQLCHKIQSLSDNQELYQFTNQLSKQCEEAIRQGKTIVAIGD